jgi:Uncharacterized protein conserved in bacteria (DUF2332)
MCFPGVLDGLGDGRIVVLNSWSFSYFPVERRPPYVEMLANVGRRRPLVWITMDTAGIVEPLEHVTPPSGSSEPDVVTAITFNGAQPPLAEVLAFVQSHGQSMSWMASELSMAAR